jgi:hypothetical protein
MLGVPVVPPRTTEHRNVLAGGIQVRVSRSRRETFLAIVQGDGQYVRM